MNEEVMAGLGPQRKIKKKCTQNTKILFISLANVGE
jgi:hypothetical protein